MAKARLLYKVNQKRGTNTKKLQQAEKEFQTLQKRQETEGATKWILNAMERCTQKLRKYGSALLSKKSA